ncbi:hypothetical protein RFI_19864, partial [Reticulomyxa filosa]
EAVNYMQHVPNARSKSPAPGADEPRKKWGPRAIGRSDWNPPEFKDSSLSADVTISFLEEPSVARIRRKSLDTENEKSYFLHNIHTYMYIYTYIHIYICTFICVYKRIPNEAKQNKTKEKKAEMERKLAPRDIGRKDNNSQENENSASSVPDTSSTGAGTPGTGEVVGTANNGTSGTTAATATTAATTTTTTATTTIATAAATTVITTPPATESPVDDKLASTQTKDGRTRASSAMIPKTSKKPVCFYLREKTHKL